MKIFSRIMKISSILLLIALLIPPAVQSATVGITDDLGNEVELDEAPERIISLAPNITEMLFAVGLGDRVVGITTYCDYPEEAMEVDTIGSITEPNIEAIVSKEPDLIVADGINPMEVIERLQELDMNVAGFYPASVQDTFSAMNRLGLVTGNIEETTEVVNEMESRMNAILDLIGDRDERPQVFYEIWNEPLTTAGGDNFIDNMISLAGGENIGAEAGSGWPQFGLEDLIYLDPEVYISTPHSADHQVSKEEILNRDNYQVLTAVQEDRVHIIDQDLVSRPSPRLIDGLKALAGAIYPEIQEELEDI
ncbi:cobalamin-binding protein [Halanaerobiaceae bacterium Z-7014]|uniref:Cobalamin-binding protein n=1 Tax=Halonatronomonas betaini TaxID=2778430 RepID=A0A931ASR1_9FIRM|nr:cobalamin-binding protein [Halonatronomonas betaini]MBF8437464.1 cobalamin-binding protein [Halonatronomonas betaini]